MKVKLWEIVFLMAIVAVIAWFCGFMASVSEEKTVLVPPGATFEVIHIPPQGDRHTSYTKESPVKVSETCMRWVNMDGMIEIACGSVQIFGLEEYEVPTPAPAPSK